jgi:putative nucleotidyltransferase with HDIG domain
MSKGFKLYSASVVLLAATGLSLASWDLSVVDSSKHWNTLVAFLTLGFLAEASYLSLRVGPGQTSSSVSFIPYIAGVLLLETGWAAAIAGSCTLVVDVAVRRKPAFRTTFNVAQATLTALVGSFVFKALGGRPALDQFVLYPLATTLAVLAYFVVNSTAVSGAVSLYYRVRLADAWYRIGGMSFVYDACSSLLAPLLAFLYIEMELLGILVLILPIYFVRHVYHVNMQLEQVNRDLLELMVKAIEARDPYTSGHSQRVSKIAELLAKDLGLGHRAVEQIRTAALLHDVGKIHEVYAPLLRKEGKLDPAEIALMQTHSVRSAELVSTISSFKGVITDAVKGHHENYDGSGYPDGISGRAIPIGSRIIMVADTIDAMTTDRPYRKALSYERVRQELVKFSGTQFDPEVVETCIKSSAVRDLVERRVYDQGLPSAANAEVAPKFEVRVKERVGRAARVR